jgi:putative ABC transport system permease protein
MLFMLRTRWQKVLIDLWRNRARTLVVALAIAVGVYAVGVVLDIREMLVREYDANLAAARPADAIVRTQPFDDELVDRIVKVPGVAAVEGRTIVRTRAHAGSALAGNGTAPPSQDLVLGVFGDYAEISVDAVTPLAGNWPPGKREIVLERQSPEFLGVDMGEAITVELDDGSQKTLTVVGIAHDPQVLGADITDSGMGMVTPETLEILGFGEDYTELHIRVTGDALRGSRTEKKAAINAVVDGVEDQLERTGREVFSRRVITDSHAGPYIDTIVLILTTFGILILLLSGFLVVNAISALITQQVQQIGVMKLIGARRLQIMAMYLLMVSVYGLIAVAIGIPLAMLTARGLMQGIVEPLLNVMPQSYGVSPFLVLMQVATGMLLPILAGLAPVFRGTRITTQQALNDVGMQANVNRQGLVERLLIQLQRLRSVQRPLVLAVRNTLRHKGRLAQTLIVLIVGTALFISVLSVRTSVDATLEDFMRFHRYDVSVELQQPYRIQRLEQAAREVPGVAGVEAWSSGQALRQRPDDTESEPMAVVGVPPETRFMVPEVSAGSWLPLDGGQAIVVNSDVVEKEPDIRVGEKVVLEIEGREASWRVAGVVPTESRGPTIYMTLEDYAHITRTPGQANLLQVINQERATAPEEMANQLRERFEARGLEVDGTQTAAAINSANELMFTVVVAFLILMALLLAAVGGLGLTTTMSINVLERVREIGVLRAVGASNFAVRRIVLVEGIVIGVLSWALGTAISLPVSVLMSEQVGLALIDVPLSYQYSATAAATWLFALLAVAVVASLGPARDAVRLTIREVLAYE